MERTFRTNKLIITIDFKTLEKKYEIFKITTIDKYISDGSYILDMPSLKIKSIFYSGIGKDLYILSSKSDNIFSLIKDYIHSQKDGDKLSIQKISLKNEKNPEYIASNLFLNSINNGNSNDFKFNNLTGNLYCFNSSKDFIKYEKDKNGNLYIGRIVALQIKINMDMCLCLDVKTFTNYKLKRYIDFNSKSHRNWYDYPQYTISKVHKPLALKRVMPSDKGNIPLENTFILRQIRGKKSYISFLLFNQLDKFSQSKIGILYYVMEIFNKQYSDIIKIDFQTIDNYISLKPKNNTKQQKILKDNINQQITSKGIRVIDSVQDEKSSNEATQLVQELKKMYSNLDIKIVKKPSKNNFNIELIHNREYHVKNKIDDIYSNNKDYIIQHVTIDNFDTSNKDLTKHIIDNILKELIVKKDLYERKISLIDWTKYNYSNDWTFISKKDEFFYFMIIHPNGTFDFKIIENDLFSINDYQKYTKCFNDKKVIEIIENPNGDINCIKDSNQFTIPQFEEIYNILFTLKNSSNMDIDTSTLLEYIKEFENSSTYKESHIKDITILKDIFITMNTIKIDELKELLKNINRNIEKFITYRFYDDYKIELFNHLQAEVQREMFLSSETDIKYFKLDNKQYYFVGYTGNGIKRQLTTSCCIREISPYDTDIIFFENLLPLMDITFVNYGELTVIPFPFKYLREYINLNKE